MVTIREAAEDDIEAVRQVGHGTWPVTYAPITGQQYVADGLARWWTAEALRPAIHAGRTFVAEDAGQVVGMASYSLVDDAVILWKLYVLPGNQGSGAGSALLDRVEAAAGAKRIRLAFLDGNGRARAFYESRGFVVTGLTEPGVIGGPANIWMEKVLR